MCAQKAFFWCTHSGSLILVQPVSTLCLCEWSRATAREVMDCVLEVPISFPSPSFGLLMVHTGKKEDKKKQRKGVRVRKTTKQPTGGDKKKRTSSTYFSERRPRSYKLENDSVRVFLHLRRNVAIHHHLPQIVLPAREMIEENRLGTMKSSIIRRREPFRPSHSP
jgi:hypothetical protein